MQLRLLERRDLETVRELRNRNREWFFDDREVTAERQREWFESLARKPVRFYVIEEDGRVVGTISVTEMPEGREIGNLLLDDAYRGRGLMSRAIEQLTEEPGTYFALLKPDNASSLRVFERLGFRSRHVYLERR
jgi:RimJ/RimL family protein N-acetyltransferase